jgi:SAM-dependent methyltransferase
MIAGKHRILEVGPGVRPRLPLDRACFVDLSATALRKLKAAGARAVLANLVDLPFPAESFDLVCALDVVEHVPEQARAFAEVARTLRPGGLFLLGVPLRPELWSTFDQAVGHHLRYDLAALSGLLAGSGFKVLKCAGFGILPGHRALVRLGSWFLRRLPGPATWFEDRMALPIARWLAPPRRWVTGLAVPRGTSGALLLLRREKSVAKVGLAQETRGSAME